MILNDVRAKVQGDTIKHERKRQSKQSKRFLICVQRVKQRDRAVWSPILWVRQRLGQVWE